MSSKESRIDKSWISVMNDQLRRYTDLISNKRTVEPPLHKSFWSNCPLCDHTKTLGADKGSDCTRCILEGCGRVSVKLGERIITMSGFRGLLLSSDTKQTKAVAIVRRQALKDRLIELGWIFKPRSYVITKHVSH